MKELQQHSNLLLQVDLPRTHLPKWQQNAQQPIRLPMLAAAVACAIQAPRHVHTETTLSNGKPS